MKTVYDLTLIWQRTMKEHNLARKTNFDWRPESFETTFK